MGSKRNMGLGGIWWCLVGFQAVSTCLTFSGLFYGNAPC